MRSWEAPPPHATRSGVAHFVCETEEECINEVRHLLSYLPGNNMDDPAPGPGRRSR